MKKAIFPLFFFFLGSLGFGQTEKSTYKTVSADFETNFNAGDFDLIFADFSPEMKSALPIEKTKEVLFGVMSQLGKIEKMEFIGYEQTCATYKTNFERGVLSVNISVDDQSQINGLFFEPFVANNLPTSERNTTKMMLPFKDEWTVIWGGDTKERNYHVESIAQKNAFDLVITDKQGKSHKTDGKTNEDYYAFGKEIVAPCNAEVVLVVDGVKDNLPGVFNPLYVPGNTVVLKTDENEFLLFAHFKQHSIAVEQGDIVKQGQLLGLCGNSGNSSEPHLHFHIQNAENMNVATGIKCYFEELVVNGQLKMDYSPIQEEKIKPLKN